MACGIEKVWQVTKHKSKICASDIYVPGEINRVNILQQRIHTQEYGNNLWEVIFKTDREKCCKLSRRGRSWRRKGLFPNNKQSFINRFKDCILSAGHKGPQRGSHNFNARTKTFGNHLVQSSTGRRTSFND